jgi:pimeloyl-ACP methyl ester carboxylesterase
LADAGYDVWLGNSRGNGYSTINHMYSPDTTDYWNFSFDEMASIDLPSQIEYVLQQTGQSKLTYIGHSEGTIVAFAALSQTPSLSKYINLYIAMAPVAYVQYVESTLLKALALLDVDEIFELLDDKSFYLPGVIDKILPDVCTITPGLCKFAVDLVAGPTTFFNESREDYYLKYFPATTSVKNMAHWSQGISEGTFSMFDYGKTGNIEHYNQPTPPQYELSNFPTQAEMPMALFAGGEDYLADPKDVQRLLSLIPSTPLVHYEAEYAHLDPLIGENAFQRIYPMILQMIDQAWVATSKNETFVLKP